jgi:hypothetical protein
VRVSRAELDARFDRYLSRFQAATGRKPGKRILTVGGVRHDASKDPHIEEQGIWELMPGSRHWLDEPFALAMAALMDEAASVSDFGAGIGHYEQAWRDGGFGGRIHVRGHARH